jgi:hypothetical protein
MRAHCGNEECVGNDKVYCIIAANASIVWLHYFRSPYLLGERVIASISVNSGAIVGQLSGGEVPAVPE